MPVYKIRVNERLSRVVSITADSKDEAFEKVDEMYCAEEIVLDASDFADSDYEFEGEQK